MANLQIYTSKSDFFSFFSIFAQNWLNIVFDPENLGFIGVWVLGLGVRVRMKGDLTTTNPLSRFFILRVGVAPNFSMFFCEFRPAGCLALKPLTNK